MTRRRMNLVLISSVMVALLIGVAGAQEEHAAPEWGPPPQMKELAGLNGVYDVEMKYKEDPTAEEWTTTTGLATIKMVLDGAAQMMDWQGEMMGKKFSGIGYTTYDREAKVWQSSWVDNMSGRMTMTSGEMSDGKMVFSGQDMMQGMKIHVRQTTHNMTEKGFEWMYEMSMDGENYMTGMTATYTKR